MTTEPTSKDKQITVDVPEDRIPEFYAFYGRFLAGFPGRRGHGHHGHGHRCGGRHRTHADEPAAAPDTGTQTA